VGFFTVVAGEADIGDGTSKISTDMLWVISEFCIKLAGPSSAPTPYFSPGWGNLGLTLNLTLEAHKFSSLIFSPGLGN
jgi:hypothetical protein